jgi:hypothetical protein
VKAAPRYSPRRSGFGLRGDQIRDVGSTEKPGTVRPGRASNAVWMMKNAKPFGPKDSTPTTGGRRGDGPCPMGIVFGGVDPARAYCWGMAAVGELVRSTSGQWMARPPLQCSRGHKLRPGRMLVGASPARVDGI